MNVVTLLFKISPMNSEFPNKQEIIEIHPSDTKSVSLLHAVKILLSKISALNSDYFNYNGGETGNTAIYF